MRTFSFLTTGSWKQFINWADIRIWSLMTSTTSRCVLLAIWSIGKIWKFSVKAWIPWFRKKEVIPICPCLARCLAPAQTHSFLQGAATLCQSPPHPVVLSVVARPYILVTCPAPHRDWSHAFGTTAVNIWIAGAASSSELPLRSSPPSQYSTPPFLSSLCICPPPFPEPSSSLSIVMKMSGRQTRSSPAQYELLTDPLENASRSLFSFSLVEVKSITSCESL